MTALFKIQRYPERKYGKNSHCSQKCQIALCTKKMRGNEGQIKKLAFRCAHDDLQYTANTHGERLLLGLEYSVTKAG